MSPYIVDRYGQGRGEGGGVEEIGTREGACGVQGGGVEGGV